jgi:hypothetical protein
MDKKIALIQCWIGKIPDYFWYHYETTKNLVGVDFYFFTDQDITLDSSNYKVFKIDLYQLETLVYKKTGFPIKILSNKKVCDLKASYGDIFYDYIKDYEYFGCYDIDTLFGDFHKYVFPIMGQFDIITIGNDVYHNRIGGPFCIFKNNTELNKLYICQEFNDCFLHEHVDCFEEGVINTKVQGKYSVKVLNDINCETSNGGKNTYDCFWRGGKVFSNNREIFLYHFYRKNKTKFNKIGNLITAHYDKKLVEDFYWVVSFTKDYEFLFINLMESIKKYSNRKCIVYSINYDFNLPLESLGSEQFIIRRIDLDTSEKDFKGRDINIITSKPKINLDVLNYNPNGNFVCIDADIYLTTNSDKIVEYFAQLEHYPLINSHVFDTVYLRNIVPNEEWSSPLHILLDEMKIPVRIFPRRKTNVVVFDNRSKWFFELQMELYKTYQNKRPGILTLHDEDTANAILNKFNLTNSLALVDTEDLDYLDFEHISNYNFSPNLRKPKTKNDILFFHGIKTQERFDAIKNDFGNSVLECEEFFIVYNGGRLSFEKNSFLSTKKNSEIVSFKVFDESENIIFNLSGRNIKNYFYFFIDGLNLQKGKYHLRITEDKDDYCIFRDIIEIN